MKRVVKKGRGDDVRVNLLERLALGTTRVF